jgi:hypothetical protein
MPCLLTIVVLMFPRVILFLMWFFTGYLDRAYRHEFLLPLLGFFFLPITTIAYAWMVNSHMPLDGFNLLILIVAVLFDAGSHSGGARYYRRRP